MKVGRFLLLMLMVCASLSIQAQRERREVEIKGDIVDAQSKTPVEQAIIQLLSVKDSTSISGVASDNEGAFSIKNVRPGEYLLHISFLGYTPVYQPLQITGNTNPVTLGKLELHENVIYLENAVITGKAPEVVVRNDTIEYNADSYKVTEGSMLEDLLKKMPGVEIDDEGKVTVNGKEIKKVLVDGKEFFSEDPKVATKNLPSHMVDKIQVLERLSEMSRLTGFDDGDEETVINLTVKPGMKEGWVGNAFAGYGSDGRYDGQMMVNRMVNNDRYTLIGGLNNTNNMGASDMGGSMYQGMGGGRGGGMGSRFGENTSGNIGLDFTKEFNEKLTINGNVHYSHFENNLLSKSTQEKINSETAFEFGNGINRGNSDNLRANFRLEWKPDDKTTLIFQPNVNYSTYDRYNNSHSTEMNLDRDTINYGDATTTYDGSGLNASGRLEFSRRLNDNGRIFSVSVSGGINDQGEDGKNDANTYYTNSDRENLIRDEKIRNDVNGYNYRAFVSWVEPLGKNYFAQLTYNINQNKQESFKNVYIPDRYGEYSIIDSLQTQNYRNNFINQRVSLTLKSIREKYNYTIGFNVDPSYSNSQNFIGDSILSNVKQKVVNFSPTAQFRYNFSRQTNLRIDYNGRTSQPSVQQLQPVPNYSNPRNVILGNPDLKPAYNNQLRVTYQHFSTKSQFTLRVMGFGGYTVNDIISYVINENNQTGNKTTTYKNINGNYNGNLMVMMNSPLKNKKFSFNSMTRTSFSNRNTIIGDKVWSNEENYVINDKNNKNTSFSLMERAGIDFRSSYLDIGINGSINYQRTRNTLQTMTDLDNNKDIFNYTLGGNTTIYLPADFKIESDIRWSTNAGDIEGFHLNEVLWNASASKSFLKGKQATLRFKMYDLLKQRNSIVYNSSANGNTYNEYNSIKSYFLVSFIYKFNIFKGGASMNDLQQRGGERGGPPNRPMGGGPMRF